MKDPKIRYPYFSATPNLGSPQEPCKEGWCWETRGLVLWGFDSHPRSKAARLHHKSQHCTQQVYRDHDQVPTEPTMP